MAAAEEGVEQPDASDEPEALEGIAEDAADVLRRIDEPLALWADAAAAQAAAGGAGTPQAWRIAANAWRTAATAAQNDDDAANALWATANAANTPEAWATAANARRTAATAWRTAATAAQNDD